MRANLRDPVCEPGVCDHMPDTHTLSGLKLLRSLVVTVCQSKIGHISTTMSTTGNELALSRFLALIDDKELRDKVEEVARFYWTSSNVTVNLLPALAATLFVIGGIMLLLWLVGFDMGGSGHSGSGSGYGAAASNKAYTYDDTIAGLQAQVNLHMCMSFSLFLTLFVEPAGGGIARERRHRRIRKLWRLRRLQPGGKVYRQCWLRCLIDLFLFTMFWGETFL